MYKILIIDDNDHNRILVRQVLARSGHEILEAANGNEGIKLARDKKPDLILLDLQMPLMNGYDVLRELRQAPERGDVKVIAITALAMMGDREKAFSAGFDAYITKPIDTRMFPVLIDNILSGERP